MEFMYVLRILSSNVIPTVLSRNPPPPKTDEQLSYCGIKFCPNVDLGNTTLIDPPKKSDIYLMSSIFLVITNICSSCCNIYGSSQQVKCLHG